MTTLALITVLGCNPHDAIGDKITVIKSPQNYTLKKSVQAISGEVAGFDCAADDCVATNQEELVGWFSNDQPFPIYAQPDHADEFMIPIGNTLQYEVVGTGASVSAQLTTTQNTAFTILPPVYTQEEPDSADTGQAQPEVEWPIVASVATKFEAKEGDIVICWSAINFVLSSDYAGDAFRDGQGLTLESGEVYLSAILDRSLFDEDPCVQQLLRIAQANSDADIDNFDHLGFALGFDGIGAAVE